MVVPVSNPSKKKRNLNIGAAPAKLEDEGGQGRVSSDYQIEGMLKQARKPRAKKRADTGQRPDSRGSGKDKDLFDTPAGVTSDGYKFYGKEGTGLGDFSRKFGIKYATQEQYEKDFDTHDGEQMGGRPGKSKMKTQGLNRSKRTGFSGRGTGAALRGF